MPPDFSSCTASLFRPVAASPTSEARSLLRCSSAVLVSRGFASSNRSASGLFRRIEDQDCSHGVECFGGQVHLHTVAGLGQLQRLGSGGGRGRRQRVVSGGGE